MKKLIQKPLIAAAALLAACIAQAQSFPTKPVRMIIPNATGGPSDLVGRVLAQKLSEAWGQSVVVDNRVGAGGNIGVDAVAKAAPDGYTILVTNSAPIVVNQFLYAKVPYDAIRDLTAISMLANSPQILLVPIASPANSLMDLIRIAKDQPGKLTFASLGSGTAPHLNGEILKMQAGVDMLHIPYRSTPQVEAALLVNEVSVFFGPTSSMQHVLAGKIKALGVTSKIRTPIAPNLPTLAESGLPDFEARSWYGLLGPAGLGGELLAKIHGDTIRVLGSADMRAKLQGIGFDMVGDTPEQFAAHIKTESARWAAVVKAAGIKAN